MEAKELKPQDVRIGNLFNEGVVYEINNACFYIWSEDEQLSLKNTWAEITPIELTEEWLLKIGCKNDKHSLTYPIHENAQLRIFKPTGNNKFWGVAIEGIKNDYGIWFRSIYFFHEWQNVVKEITGEELTLNP